MAKSKSEAPKEFWKFSDEDLDRALSDYQIYPFHDLEEHVESEDCWCQPNIVGTGVPFIVVHHALDGREYRNCRKVSPKCPKQKM